MSNLFEDFKPISLATWTDQIVKDLKGKDVSTLYFNDPIEEIDYKAFYHSDDASIPNSKPGSFPATRGSKTSNNDWTNAAYIKVDNAAEANKHALKVLMQGADMIFFESSKVFDWTVVLNEVELNYIKAQFKVSSVKEALTILEIAGEATNNIAFCFDALDVSDAIDLLPAMRNNQVSSFVVNGFGVQKCGATSWQELAFALATGHEALVQIMKQGFEIDEAAAMIHFHIGVGSNYFNEIAKFRSLRMLWSKIIEAYHPKHDCSLNCAITAIIGHSNKSLKDPYTNLLRQTTEVMSASNGADAILVLPYDLYSSKGASELASRMALNISLILKEESYFHHVLDPSGGSYTIEHLTSEVAKKAWETFQTIESKGGISQSAVLNELKQEILKKKSLRESKIADGSNTLIGVNKFPDSKEHDVTWETVPGYLGMDAMQVDSINKTETV